MSRKECEVYMPEGGGMISQPWKVLAVAMVCQAVDDLRELRRHGAVKGDRWAWGTYWPKQPSGRNAKIACFYNQPSPAREVLEFFSRGTAEILMEMIGGVDAGTAMQKLGFGNRKKEAKV
jgi:hypothetical protein